MNDAPPPAPKPKRTRKARPPLDLMTIPERPVMGRPRIEIDEQDFESLCEIQCNTAELCHFFKCSQDTLERWAKDLYGQTLAEVREEKAQGGRISLRRKMYRMANDGDRVMLIWLSKQYLGMSEKVESKNLNLNKNETITYKAKFQDPLPQDILAESKEIEPAPALTAPEAPAEEPK